MNGGKGRVREEERKLNVFEFLSATAIGLALNFLGDHPLNYWFHIEAWDSLPVKFPDIQSLIYLRSAGMISDEQFYNVMQKYGYVQDNAEGLYWAMKQKMSAGEIVRYGFKNRLPEETIVNELKLAGYDEVTAKKLVNVYEYLPSVSDLIRFSVRDVYTPETIKKYGMDKEFPEKFVEDASKQGISKETARKYWIAHWELPSIGAVYEMLHRLPADKPRKRFKEYEEMGLSYENLVTDVDTVKDLIRRQDIEPYWRERLVALSYQPITRIDVRRMYRMGVFDEEDVYWAYRDLGYTPENARKLTEFVKKEKLESEKDLSMTYIREALELGLIEEDKALEYIKELGYTEDEAELILSIEKYKIEMDTLKEKIDTVRNFFLAGQITYDEAVRELDALNIPASMRDNLISRFVRQLSKERKKPSKTDIELFLKTGQISEDEAKQLLIWIGYDKVFAEMFVRAWTKGGAS